MPTTKATHTPGPWTVSVEHDPQLPFSVMADGYYIATPHLGVPGETEANARLIAAAPDLLVALKRAKEALKANEDMTGTWKLYQSSPEMQAINAALTKAEGA